MGENGMKAICNPLNSLGFSRGLIPKSWHGIVNLSKRDGPQTKRLRATCPNKRLV
jgi:hypothetical protein